jgi:uncharacterized protein
MDVTPLIRPGTQVIQAYAGGKFRVSGQTYTTSLIIFPEGVQAWNPSDEPIFEDFAPLLAKKDELDVVLFGTGKAMKILPSSLRKQLKEAGLAVEAMDTGAACRTYNVLMAEGRRVAAALTLNS